MGTSGYGVSGQPFALGNLGDVTMDGAGPTLTLTGQVSLSIAQGESAALAIGSYALLTAAELAVTGDMAVYLCANNGAYLLGSKLGVWTAATKTPDPGKISVEWDGSSAYRIYNNQGSTIGVRAFSVKML